MALLRSESRAADSWGFLLGEQGARVSFEYTWVSSQATRNELARLIRDNLEDFTEGCMSHFVEDYPHSRANDLPVGVVESWTKHELLQLCETLERGEFAPHHYGNTNGDIFEDVHEIEFAKFVNSVAAILSMSRTMSAVINRLCIENGSRARSLVSCLEDLAKFIIFGNLDAYRAALEPSASLSLRWDMFGRVAERVEGDPTALTPRERYARKPIEADRDSGKGVSVETTAEPSAGCLDDSSLEDDSRRLKEPMGLPLSRREHDVLLMLAEGKTNNEICLALGIKLSTVKSYVSRIFDKYNVNSRAELLAKIL